MATTKQNDATGALGARQKVEKLLNAARDGDLAGFKDAAEIIGEGEETAEAVGDAKDGNGLGPLHFAVRGGHENICKYLVEELQLPVDAVDDEGETPLIFAARAGFNSIAKYLLDHGANPKAAAQDLETWALHHAAGTGSLELIKLLLEKGVAVDVASSSGTPLIWAAGHGRLEALTLLLNRGADANSSNKDGATPLLTAVAAQQTEIVELLIKHGAETNIVAGGVTPLHIAAEQGNKQTIKLLLAAGANPNVTDEAEMTPIQVAALSGHHPIVKLLLPVTSVLSAVDEWSVDGLLKHAKQLAADEERFDEAASACQCGEKVNPESKEVMDAFKCASVCSGAMDPDKLVKRESSLRKNRSAQGKHLESDDSNKLAEPVSASKTTFKASNGFVLDLKKPLVLQVGNLGQDYHDWVHQAIVTKETPFFFGNKFLEMNTRTVWWVVPLIWLPVVCYLQFLSIQRGLPVYCLPPAIATGILLWSFIEYSLHRHLFHVKTTSYWANTGHYILHGCHHKYPLDGLRLVFPPAGTAIFCVLFWNTLKSILPKTVMPSAFGGGLLGYVIYDLTHYFLHHGVPFDSITRKLKRYHLNHHFKEQTTGFGITSSLWDRVFNTLPTKTA